VRSYTDETAAFARGCKTFFDVTDMSAVVVDHIAGIGAVTPKPFQVRQEFVGDADSTAPFFRLGFPLAAKINQAVL
jgi:hypothetical protein